MTNVAADLHSSALPNHECLLRPLLGSDTFLSINRTFGEKFAS